MGAQSAIGLIDFVGKLGYRHGALAGVSIVFPGVTLMQRRRGWNFVVDRPSLGSRPKKDASNLAWHTLVVNAVQGPVWIAGGEWSRRRPLPVQTCSSIGRAIQRWPGFPARFPTSGFNRSRNHWRGVGGLSR
jgi:hypothetical protein